MELIAKIFVAIVALEHLYIVYLEMFAWETAGKKAFRGAVPDTLFSQTKAIAANQGLYNGFLAAGLIWSLLISDPVWWSNIAIFFLSCVFVAGLYGALTVARKIFVIQAIPALLALQFVIIARNLS